MQGSVVANDVTLQEFSPADVLGTLVAIRALHGRPDQKGTADPICGNGVERINPIRITNGLPPIQILAGAYAPKRVL